MEQSISDQESTILVAGSALENLELLSQMLELDGYVVLRVTQVEKIIEAALLHGPDLILLDMIGPDRDGMNICQHIKACDSLNNIPVIFIQPRADWKRIAEGFKIGGSDYISTPIIPEEARARIGYYLKLHATIKLHDALLKQVDEHNKKIEATIKEKNKQDYPSHYRWASTTRYRLSQNGPAQRKQLNLRKHWIHFPLLTQQKIVQNKENSPKKTISAKHLFGIFYAFYT